MLLRGRGGKGWGSAVLGIRICALRLDICVTGVRTSHGITGALGIGKPTLVFTAKPTVEPAFMKAVFVAWAEVVRPQRREGEEGSVMGVI